LFKDDSPKTAAKQARGRLPGIARAAGGPTGMFSAKELRALFNEQNLPSQSEACSCKSYWGSWKLVLAWGLAHGIMYGIMDQLMSLHGPCRPMSLANLEAPIMEPTVLGMAANSMAANSIKNMMACIQARHRMCGLAPPILPSQSKLFARMGRDWAGPDQTSKAGGA
jgi:hypothetical protein